MASKQLKYRRPLGRAAAALGLALAALGPAAPAVAADPFSALVGEKRERRAEPQAQPQVQRYMVSADGRVFLFQPKGLRARVMFLCRDGDPRLDCRIDPEGTAEEIFVLTAVRGSRGDTIYKNRQGDTLLRIAAYGGATVFWPGEAYGQAASKSFGEDAALDLPSADRAAAWRRARFATAHLSAMTGAPIVFDIGRQTRPPVVSAFSAMQSAAARAPMAARQREFASEARFAAETSGAAGAAADQAYAVDDAFTDDNVEGASRDRREASVLADAVARVAGGMQQVADDPTGAKIMGDRVKAVRFVSGDAAALAFDNGELKIVYNPAGDLGGRPSSAAVARFLEDSL